MQAINTTANPIIMFDGVCNYCNSMVNFAIKWNRKKNLRFTPLQSNTAAILKQQYNVPNTIDSVVFITNNKAYYLSTAALKITLQLSFPVKLLGILLIIPPFIRNTFYAWVAKNRYKWFGQKETCIIPSKEVKMLFLN